MANGSFGGGTGTSVNPYLIEDALDLNAIRNSASSTYKLVNHINLSSYATGTGWNPIPSFTGTLDGNGFTIQNLYISNSASSNLGLFISLGANGTIINLGLENVLIIGNGTVGGFAGSVVGAGASIRRSYISGHITATSSFGGFVGSNTQNFVLENCLSYCNLNTTNTGTVNGGGLIGTTSGSGTIKNCLYAGYINGTGTAYGATVGAFTATTFTNVFYDSSLTSKFIASSGTALTGTTSKQITSYTNWNLESIQFRDTKINTKQAINLNALTPVAYWALNGNTNDGYSTKNATAVSMSYINFGTASVANITNSSNRYGYDNIVASNTNLSFCGWYKINPSTKSGNIYDNYVGGFTTKSANGIAYGISTSGKYAIVFCGTTPSNPTGGHLEFESSVSVENKFVHLCLTKEGNTVRLYLNGSKIVENTITHNVGLNFLNTYLNSGGYYRTVSALEYDVMVFNRVLTEQEIQSISTTPIEELVDYQNVSVWKFETGSYPGLWYEKNPLVLVKSNNNYKRYKISTDSWSDIQSTYPTQLQFAKNGFRNPSLISRAKWKELSDIGNIDILTLIPENKNKTYLELGTRTSGNGRSFNGTNQYFTFSNPIIPTGSKTISFKMKRNGVPASTYERILCNGMLNTDNNLHICLGKQGDVYNGVNMAGGLYYFVTQGTTNKVLIYEGTNVCDNKWHDIMFVQNDVTQTISYYIDGNLKKSVSYIAGQTDSLPYSKNMVIGASYATASTYQEFFGGSLDDIQILGSTGNVIAHWKMNETSATSNLIDSSSVGITSLGSKINLSGGSGGRGGQTTYTAANGVVVTSSAPTYSNSNLYYLEYLFNGNITSSQSDTRYWLTTSSGNQTLTFDFNSIGNQNINLIRVYPRARDDASSNYRILVSNDNVTYTEVLSWTTSSTSTPYGTAFDHSVSISSRYIRFELTQNGSYGVTLDEIEFYVGAVGKTAYTGTQVNSPGIVTGEGPVILADNYSRIFNGTTDHVQFSNPIIPRGSKTISFDIFRNGLPPAISGNEYFILGNVWDGTKNGMLFSLNTSGKIVCVLFNSSGTNFIMTSNTSVCDNRWHSIRFTWDGTVTTNAVKLFIDNNTTPDVTTTATSTELNPPTDNFSIGVISASTSDARKFSGYLKNLKIYKGVVSSSDSISNTDTISMPQLIGGGNSEVTLNPSDTISSHTSLSNNNLTLSHVNNGGNYGAARTLQSITSGKWYWEATINNYASLNYVPRLRVGLMTKNVSLDSIYTNSANVAAYDGTYATNDVIGVAVDTVAGTVQFYRNNTLAQTLTGYNFSTAFYPAGGTYGNTPWGAGSHDQITFNFGLSTFVYSPPSGYSSLATNPYQAFGTITVSSRTTGGQFEAYRVFDGNAAGSNFYESNTETMPHWIKVDFAGDARIVNQFTLSSGDAENLRMPYNFTFRGSNNNSTWTTLYTGTNVLFNLNETKTFTFSNQLSYRYYDLNVTSNAPGSSNANILRIYEMNLYTNKLVLNLPFGESNNSTIVSDKGPYSFTLTQSGSLGSSPATELFYRFNGREDRINYPVQIIPVGAKVIQFDFRKSNTLTKNQAIISNGKLKFILKTNGKINVNFYNNSMAFSLDSSIAINDGQWHKVMLIWDGTTNLNGVKLYIDNMSIPDSMTTSLETESANYNYLNIGTDKINNISAFYQFENSLLDSSESTNNLTGVAATYTTGKNGQGFSAGVGKHYYVSNILKQPSAFTIGGWYKVNPTTKSANIYQNIFGCIKATTGSATNIGYGISTDGFFSIINTQEVPPYYNEYKSNILVADTFTHVVLTRNNNTYSLYINGSLATTITYSGMPSDALNFYSTYYNSTASTWFRTVTSIDDEVFVSNLVLSSTDINTIYTNGIESFYNNLEDSFSGDLKNLCIGTYKENQLILDTDNVIDITPTVAISTETEISNTISNQSASVITEVASDIIPTVIVTNETEIANTISNQSAAVITETAQDIVPTVSITNETEISNTISNQSAAVITETSQDIIPTVSITTETATGNSLLGNTSFTTAVPFAKFVKANGDILLESIETIDSLQVTASTSGAGVVKMIASSDSGVTWKSYYNGAWTTVTDTDLSDVKTKGMSPTVFSALTNTEWQQLISSSKKVRFAYYLEIDSVSDSASTDKLVLQFDALGSWKAMPYGGDWEYEMVSLKRARVYIYANGSYKINY